MDSTKPTRRPRGKANERTFLANAAHELRTPLHSANGFVEMVLDGLAGPLNERQREMLGYAQISIGQLTLLIEEILFLARADSGELVPHLSAVDPAATLTLAISSVREHLRENTITLTRTDAELPTTIRVDGERLREGLAGLLRAGIAMMPPEGVMVVAASTHEQMLQFAVTLTGVQLNATDLIHLFERFYQPRPLGADRSAHPGLGLVIAQKTADWHGGNVQAIPAPDDGGLVLCYEVPLGGS
jgi:signal transduction histidine kinase